MHKINNLLYKNGMSHIVKLLKLVSALAIGDAPIHDFATREFGNEHAFGYFDLILDRVTKSCTKQSTNRSIVLFTLNCADSYVGPTPPPQPPPPHCLT